MLESLSTIFLLTAFAGYAVSAVLPRYVMWQAALLSILMGLAAFILRAPVAVTFGDDIFSLAIQVYTFTLGGVATLILLLRTVFQKSPKRSVPRRHLICIGLCIGAVGGLAAVSLNMGRVPWAPILFWGLAGTALVAGMVLFWRRTQGPSVVIPAILCGTGGMLLVILLVGTPQPERILRQGAEIADGRDWCLVRPPVADAVTDMDQLAFLSLPRGGVRPHLLLRIRGEDSEFIWSVRQQKFARFRGFVDRSGWGGACLHRSDFAEALRDDLVMGGLYSIGPYTFRPPQADLRRVGADHLILEADPLVTPPDTRFIHDFVNDVEFWTDADPPSPWGEVADLEDTALDPAALRVIPASQALRLFGDRGPRDLTRIDCPPDGAKTRICRVSALRGTDRYDFRLALEDLGTWPEELTRIQARFDAMRVEN